MNIKEQLKIRLDLINNQIEIYKKNAIEEIENVNDKIRMYKKRNIKMYKNVQY